MTITSPVLLHVGGRDWECRPTIPESLAGKAARVSTRLATMPHGRNRQRVADRLFREFIRRQVVNGFELLRAIDNNPDLWPEAVDAACLLVVRYEVEERVV